MRVTDRLVGQPSTVDRWDKTAYARWHFQKLKRSHKPDAPPMKYYSEDYDPECFPDDSVNEAVFEVEMQQRHNKVSHLSVGFSQ